MKRAIIIHGCPSGEEKDVPPEKQTYDKHWIPWLKEELEKRGIETIVPRMPDPWNPDYTTFETAFNQYHIDADTILIGHSCGASFLTRWLGAHKINVAKLVLVAPWYVADEETDESRAFYEFDIDASIQDRVTDIVFFTSNNEHPDGIKSIEIGHALLGGKVINLENKGHYTEGDMGTVVVPELLEEVLR